MNRNLANSRGKGLFLDCGSNIGQGFEFFRKYYPTELYDYVLFEPNPYCFQILKEKYSGLSVDGVQLRNVAVGIHNGEIDFYGLEETQGGIYSVGGSILAAHNSGLYTNSGNSSIQVRSINFIDYLSDFINQKKYSAIILKLDIEGGEYQILDSLEKSEMFDFFETIYVEFHAQYMNKEFSQFYKNKEKHFFEITRKTKTRVINWI
jgi:FkbM family methyltransferase